MLLTLPALAATGYGVSDFAGGLAARRRPPSTGMLHSQVAGLVLVVGLLPLAPGSMTAAGVLLAAAAGCSGLAGLWLMYRLMVTTPLSLVSSFTAVLAAGTPVLFGLAVGEHLRVAAVCGIAAGLLSVALIAAPSKGGSHQGRPLAARTGSMAAGAGAGFGAFFILIARSGGEHCGLAPLLVARTTSVIVVAVLALVGRSAGRPDRWATGLMAAAGTADAAADACYLFATRGGSLSLTVTVTALYPAITAVLALLILREHVGWRCRCGLVSSVVSLVLLAT